jgi:hypothetical protein
LFLISSGLTQLNSSLAGIDIRLNTTSNQPEWSARGAGSWSPFSPEFRVIICTSQQQTWNQIVYDFTTGAKVQDNIYAGHQSTLPEDNEYVERTYNVPYASISFTFTIKKAGYYLNGNDNQVPVYKNVGDTMECYYYLAYCGESNVFQ